jgi:hypothetical protein
VRFEEINASVICGVDPVSILLANSLPRLSGTAAPLGLLAGPGTMVAFHTDRARRRTTRTEFASSIA